MGYVEPGQTAEVRINYLPGQSSYQASTRYGVTTYDYGAWAGSISMDLLYAHPLPNDPPTAYFSPPSSALFWDEVRVNILEGQNYDFYIAAEDIDGTISKIELVADGQVLASINGLSQSTAYRAIAFPSSQFGTWYDAHFRVYDNRGAWSVAEIDPSILDPYSPLFGLTEFEARVDARPWINLSIASSGPFYEFGAIPISANAGDPDGSVRKVEFYLDGLLKRVDTQAPFDYTLELARPGSRTIGATVYDWGGHAVNAGNLGFSVASAQNLPGVLDTTYVDVNNDGRLDRVVDAFINRNESWYASPSQTGDLHGAASFWQEAVEGEPDCYQAGWTFWFPSFWSGFMVGDYYYPLPSYFSYSYGYEVCEIQIESVNGNVAFPSQPGRQYQVQTRQDSNAPWITDPEVGTVNGLGSILNIRFGDWRWVLDIPFFVRIVELALDSGSQPPLEFAPAEDIDLDGTPDWAAEVEVDVIGPPQNGLLDVRIPAGVIVRPLEAPGNIIEIQTKPVGQLVWEKAAEYILTGEISFPIDLQIVDGVKVRVVLRSKRANLEGFVALNDDDDDGDGTMDLQDLGPVEANRIDEDLVEWRNPYHSAHGGWVRAKIRYSGAGEIRLWETDGKSQPLLIQQDGQAVLWSADTAPSSIWIEGIVQSEALEDVKLYWEHSLNLGFPAGELQSVEDRITVVDTDIVVDGADQETYLTPSVLPNDQRPQLHFVTARHQGDVVLRSEISAGLASQLSWATSASGVSLDVQGDKRILKLSSQMDVGKKIPLTLSLNGAPIQNSVAWVVSANLQNFANPVHVFDQTMVFVYATWTFQFTFKIHPEEIIADSDRPSLDGEKVSNPPYVPVIPDNDVVNRGKDLSSGAFNRWDVSRQIRARFIDPTNALSPAEKLAKSGEEYPSDVFVGIGEIIGNDDFDLDGDAGSGVKDEDNNPYDPSPEPHLPWLEAGQGMLSSFDNPGFTITKDKLPNVGDEVTMILHSKEFVRLNLGDGQTANWYRISDWVPWRSIITVRRSGFDEYSRPSESNKAEQNNSEW